MGAVWLADDQVLGREVAVKRIGQFHDGTSPDLMRAQREAKLAAKLNHPHVVAVFDFVSERDEQWLVMEHVDGADLAVLAEHVRRPAARRGRGAARAGRRRPGRRPRGGHRAPGRQAVQRAGDPRRHREARGLRHRPGARLDDDGVRSGVGVAGVPRARGGVRPSRHRGQRRLVARRDAVPGPHRPAAVRHLRQRPVGHVPHRARGTAPPARPRVARRSARDHDGHRPRGPLADEPGPRLPPRRATGRRGAARRRRWRITTTAPDAVDTAVQHEVPAERRSWLLPALLALAVLARRRRARVAAAPARLHAHGREAERRGLVEADEVPVAHAVAHPVGVRDARFLDPVDGIVRRPPARRPRSRRREEAARPPCAPSSSSTSTRPSPTPAAAWDQLTPALPAGLLRRQRGQLRGLLEHDRVGDPA